MISKKSCFIFLVAVFNSLNVQAQPCTQTPFCPGIITCNCYGSCPYIQGGIQNPSRLYLSTLPQGGMPPYKYQWMGSYTNSSGWTDLSGDTTSVLENVLFKSFRYFRLKVTDAAGAVAYTASSQYIYNCQVMGGQIGVKSPLSSFWGNSVVMPIGYSFPFTIQSVSDGYNTTQNPRFYDWLTAKGVNLPLDSFRFIPGASSTTYTIPNTISNRTGAVSYRRFLYDYDCDCRYDYSSYTNELTISYINGNPFNPGTIIPSTQNALIGAGIHFNASTPASGGLGPYAYQWQDSIPSSTNGWIDIPGATGSTYFTVLTQHKFFRRRAWDMVNRIAFSSEIRLRPISSIINFIDTTTTTYAVNNVAGNVWFTLVDTSDNIIAAIFPGTNQLGNVTLKFKHFGTGVANVPVSNAGIIYMPRYFELSSSAYPNGNIPGTVSVRLYFKNSEFNDFKTKIGNTALSTSNLRVLNYQGNLHDCDLNNNISGSTTEIVPYHASFSDGFSLEYPIFSFSGEFGVISNLGPLPVTWMNFTGALKEKKIQLNWSVANQQNNKGFEIQRSSNGTNFQSIGFVHATVANNYSFTDIAPLANVNHYRLRQVDINGDATYSNTITIKSNSKNQFTVFPNPVKDYFIVQAATNKNIQYVIVNANGQTILKGITNNGKQIDVSQLPKGTYALQLFVDNDKQVFKVVRL